MDNKSKHMIPCVEGYLPGFKWHMLKEGTIYNQILDRKPRWAFDWSFPACILWFPGLCSIVMVRFLPPPPSSIEEEEDRARSCFLDLMGEE